MVNRKSVLQNWFFDGFREKEMATLLSLGCEALHPQGEKIAVQGKPADSFHILIHGMVVVKIETKEHGEMILSTLKKAGDLFGWSALLEEGRSTATVECLEESRILSYRKKDLETLFEQDPKLGYRFMRRLARLISNRLESTRALLIQYLS